MMVSVLCCLVCATYTVYSVCTQGNTCVVCKLRAVIGHTQLAVFTANS